MPRGERRSRGRDSRGAMGLAVDGRSTENQRRAGGGSSARAVGRVHRGGLGRRRRGLGDPARGSARARPAAGVAPATGRRFTPAGVRRARAVRGRGRLRRHDVGGRGIGNRPGEGGAPRPDGQRLRRGGEPPVVSSRFARPRARGGHRVLGRARGLETRGGRRREGRVRLDRRRWGIAHAFGGPRALRRRAGGHALGERPVPGVRRVRGRLRASGGLRSGVT
mmetsp:Transcript_10674/g.32911  ORF Transcript_10674/g.32911 Transcript_10674/m.32911 type:complete len:222 (-) Transcript_10674:1457-2122(-)